MSETNPTTRTPSPDAASSLAPPIIEVQKKEVLPVTAQRKFVEAGLVTHAAVGRKCAEKPTHDKKASPQEQAQFQATREAVSAYNLFSSIKHDPTFTIDKPIPLTEGTKYCFAKKAGKWIGVASGSFVISGLEGIEVNVAGTFVKCRMGARIESIPIDELIRAQVLSQEGALVESALSTNPEAQKVTHDYFEALKNNSNELQTDESLIQLAGEQTGVLTSKTMRDTIKNGEVPEEKKESLMHLLDGIGVVDRQTAGKIIAGLDTLGADLQVVTATLEAEMAGLAELEARLKSTPDGQYKAQLQMEIDAQKGIIGQHKERQAELQGLRDVIAKMPGGAEAGIANILKPLYDGTLNPEQNGRVIAALRKGNMNGLLKELTDEAEKDPKKKGLASLARKALQYGGVGIAAVMVIMLMNGMKES